MNMAVVQPIWCRWGCRCFLPSLLSLYHSMLLMRVMGVFQQPLCCCCYWLWFTGLTLQVGWWCWGWWVYFNIRCGFLALQSYESCLVLRRSRLPCVNKRFISGSSWAWWRWWCWGLEGLCVSVCNVLSSLLKAYDEVCVFEPKSTTTTTVLWTYDDHATMRESLSLVQNIRFIGYSDMYFLLIRGKFCRKPV